MKTIFKYIKGLMGLMGIFVHLLAFGQTAAPVTGRLKIGDPAPALNATWLKGGSPAKFGDGKVHVVEFWATWCGPCRGNMPHLSEIARKYRDQVIVTGVSIWEGTHLEEKTQDNIIAKARKLVDNAHDMMDYIVGVDNVENTIAKSWMTASGHGGIPYTFVVDQDGKIAWMGSPYLLGQILPLVIQRKLGEEVRIHIEKDFNDRVNNYMSLLKQADDALLHEDYNTALSLADQIMQITPEFSSEVIPIKYKVYSHTDFEKGRIYAHEIMESHKSAPILLSGMARAMLEDKYKKPDYQTALELIQTAMNSLDPADAGQLSLLAKVYYRMKNYDKAIEIISGLLNNPDNDLSFSEKMYAEEALKLYKSRKQK